VNNQVTITDHLRNYIEENGLRLNFVAEKSGIQEKKFYRLISGKQQMTIKEFEQICSSLSVDPSYFFKHKFLVTKNKPKQ
jgi:predicted transcriptional regulator